MQRVVGARGQVDTKMVDKVTDTILPLIHLVGVRDQVDKSFSKGLTSKRRVPTQFWRPVCSAPGTTTPPAPAVRYCVLATSSVAVPNLSKKKCTPGKILTSRVHPRPVAGRGGGGAMARASTIWGGGIQMRSQIWVGL